MVNKTLPNEPAGASRAGSGTAPAPGPELSPAAIDAIHLGEEPANDHCLAVVYCDMSLNEIG